jgi:hypothetical protein
MLFVTPEWRRLIPTSWQIVPDASHAMLRYLSLHVVETPGAYNALQQLSYAAVVFLLAPFSIATGVAMSPAVAARFPWYIKIFHGRQGARSLHFLALCAFIVFFIGHITIVALHGFRRELALIILIGHEISTQKYSPADTSPYFWVNGRPPTEEHFLAMAHDKFANYRLDVSGLVTKQLHLTLIDLRAMPKQTQITKHCCIQGWSGIAEWGGVSLHHIVRLCHPLPTARYIVFYAFDNIIHVGATRPRTGVLLWHDSLGAGGRSADHSCLRNERPAAADFARSAAPTSGRNAAWLHHGEVHPRYRVYPRLHNRWPGPRRLARGLSVFQPGGRDLIQNVCTSSCFDDWAFHAIVESLSRSSRDKKE